jgi:hypothetical protein
MQKGRDNQIWQRSCTRTRHGSLVTCPLECEESQHEAHPSCRCHVFLRVNSTGSHWTCNVGALKSLNLQTRLTRHWTCILGAPVVTNRSVWRFLSKPVRSKVLTNQKMTCGIVTFAKKSVNIFSSMCVLDARFWPIKRWHVALYNFCKKNPWIFFLACVSLMLPYRSHMSLAEEQIKI